MSNISSWIFLSNFASLLFSKVSLNISKYSSSSELWDSKVSGNIDDLLSGIKSGVA